MRKSTPDKEIASKIEEQYNLAHSIYLIKLLFKGEDIDKLDDAIQNFIYSYNNLNGDLFDFERFHRSIERKIIKINNNKEENSNKALEV